MFGGFVPFRFNYAFLTLLDFFSIFSISHIIFNLYLIFVKVKYEAGTTKWTVRGLEKYGHDTEPYHLGESIVQVSFSFVLFRLQQSVGLVTNCIFYMHGHGTGILTNNSKRKFSHNPLPSPLPPFFVCANGAFVHI